MAAPLYVAGLGCRRGCAVSQLLELLLQSLHEHGLQPGDLAALASSTHKHDEAGLRQLAEQLQLPLLWLSAEQLAGYHNSLSQHSPLSLQITGSAGVAEASALAQAEALSGARAELLCAKRSNANATCAIAMVRTTA